MNNEMPITSEKAVSISMRELTAEFVHITPSIAAEWLSKSEIKNRDWRPGKVKAYAQAMLRGKFLLNGQTIIFDATGGILDGHHRLKACVESDIAFDALLVRGMDRKVMSTIDTGAARDIADDLTISSPAHRILNRRISSTLPLIMQYCSSKPKVASYWSTVPGKREILDSNPDIAEAVSKVNAPKKPLVRESVLGALYFLGAIAHAEKTDQFIGQFIHGVDLKEGDPAHTLREYLISTSRKLSSTRSHMSNWEVFRACSQGLERFIKGEQMKIVRPTKRPSIPGADPDVLHQRFFGTETKD